MLHVTVRFGRDDASRVDRLIRERKTPLLSGNGFQPAGTAMPQFLYRIQPTRLGMLVEGPTELEAAITGEHFRYLQKLVEDGVVLMAGRTLNADASTFGIVVLVASSEAEAAERMKNDPAVKHGVMRAELFPYRVGLWSAQGPGE